MTNRKFDTNEKKKTRPQNEEFELQLNLQQRSDAIDCMTTIKPTTTTTVTDRLMNECIAADEQEPLLEFNQQQQDHQQITVAVTTTKPETEVGDLGRFNY